MSQSDTATSSDRPALQATDTPAPRPSPGRVVLIARRAGEAPEVALVLRAEELASADQMKVDVVRFVWEPFHVTPMKGVAFGSADKPGTWYWPPRV